MRRQGYVGESAGFTLVELLVVIGIIVILLGISIPIALRMTAGSKLMDCEAKLHKIQQALRAYQLDEGGFPPYFFSGGQIHGRGLLALADAGYLRSRQSLRCPADHEDYSAEFDMYAPGHAAGNPVYKYDHLDAVSYQWIDYNATMPPTGIPPFKYLTDRGVGQGDPDYDRNRIPEHSRGPSFRPDDTTVLTWCDLHERVITEGSKNVNGDEVPSGQYIVLFYDGRMQKMHSYLFRSGDTSQVPPESPWRVWPHQMAWNAGAPLY